jgi:hypothetical protein
MAMPGHDGYKAAMFKPVSLTSLVLAFALGFALALSALADTTPPKKKSAVTRHLKHHVKRWTTPPGYRSPREIEREETKAWRRDRAFAWRHNAPRAYYYYYGPPYYNGRFGANRYDSLQVGPCWTQTPIGAMWNCGK